MIAIRWGSVTSSGGQNCGATEHFGGKIGMAAVTIQPVGGHEDLTGSASLGKRDVAGQALLRGEAFRLC